MKNFLTVFIIVLVLLSSEIFIFLKNIYYSFLGVPEENIHIVDVIRETSRKRRDLRYVLINNILSQSKFKYYFTARNNNKTNKYNRRYDAVHYFD